MSLFRRTEAQYLRNPDRRDLLITSLAVSVGVVVGAKVENRFNLFHGDDESNGKEVLVNPDKFEAYIDKFYGVAKGLSESEAKPIPYEVFLAVSMHESDSGTSELAKNANNYFGVIAKDGWDGEVYDKPTEEEINTADIDSYKAQKGFEVVEDSNSLPGRSRVRYVRPFRKYKSPDDSFADFAEKLFFKEEDGKYRYQDVVDYLNSGGRDPYEVIDLMSDNDEPGELQYATGSEWREGVGRYISLIQNRTKDVSQGTKIAVEDVELPPNIEAINLEELDFSEFKEPRDRQLKDRITEAFGNINHERWLAYVGSGVEQKSSLVRELTDIEYYAEAYGLNQPIKPGFLVWHLWGNGVVDDGNNDQWPKGSSLDITLEEQIRSWFNRYQDDTASASCGYMLGSDGETWQLVEDRFDRTWHVGTGIQDSQASISHPGVDNDNAIGIEVQADSVGNVSAQQFENLIYWTAVMLLEAGIVREGMTREEVNEAIESSVVGHGKNSGLEFGSKYTKPIKQALQQFMFMAI